MEVELAVRDALSLKDKRRVVKSLKDRLTNRFNVSVAEVDALQHRQRAVLAVAMVANDAGFLNSALSKIADYIRADPRAGLVDYSIEML